MTFGKRAAFRPGGAAEPTRATMGKIKQARKAVIARILEGDGRAPQAQ